MNEKENQSFLLCDMQSEIENAAAVLFLMNRLNDVYFVCTVFVLKNRSNSCLGFMIDKAVKFVD